MKTIIKFFKSLISCFNIAIDVDLISIGISYVRPHRCFAIHILLIEIFIYVPEYRKKIEGEYISRTSVKVGHDYYTCRIARNNTLRKCYYTNFFNDSTKKTFIDSFVHYFNPIFIGDNKVRVQDKYSKTYLYAIDELYYQIPNHNVKGYIKNGIFYITSAVG